MILIKSGQIIDGTGKPPFKGDILIDEKRISAIGSFPTKKADLVIDALGLTIAPGFIDVNTDSDHYLSLLTYPAQADFLLQGVTSIIGGQCGSSLAPLLYGSLKSIRKWGDIDQVNIDWGTVSELKETLSRRKLGVNFGTLVGHSTIRRDILGEELRDLTSTELEVFTVILREALQDGALGLSTGLGYAHSRDVPYFEIKTLLSTVKEYHGIYATHLRDEKENIVSSVKETVGLAEETGLPVIINHFRSLIGLEQKFQEALSLIENNLNKANVFFDINPFGVSVMPIYTFLPSWAQQGGIEQMWELLNDKNYRSQILNDILQLKINFNDLTIAQAQSNPYVVGKTLSEFADARNMSAAEALLFLMEITKFKSLLFYKNINENIAEELLFHPRSLIASNGASIADDPFQLKPERTWNTFPKFLDLALERRLPLEEAIKKITSAPAKILKLNKRGELREGWFADITILENTKVRQVMVNGGLAVRDGKLQKGRFGTSL